MMFPKVLKGDSSSFLDSKTTASEAPMEASKRRKGKKIEVNGTLNPGRLLCPRVPILL